ncbi:hypothetical protein DFH06DRAFT_1475763, partial [Mycena polygramma]
MKEGAGAVATWPSPTPFSARVFSSCGVAVSSLQGMQMYGSARRHLSSIWNCFPPFVSAVGRTLGVSFSTALSITFSPARLPPRSVLVPSFIFTLISVPVRVPSFPCSCLHSRGDEDEGTRGGASGLVWRTGYTIGRAGVVSPASLRGGLWDYLRIVSGMKGRAGALLALTPSYLHPLFLHLSFFVFVLLPLHPSFVVPLPSSLLLHPPLSPSSPFHPLPPSPPQARTNNSFLIQSASNPEKQAQPRANARATPRARLRPRRPPLPSCLRHTHYHTPPLSIAAGLASTSASGATSATHPTSATSTSTSASAAIHTGATESATPLGETTSSSDTETGTAATNPGDTPPPMPWKPLEMLCAVYTSSPTIPPSSLTPGMASSSSSPPPASGRRNSLERARFPSSVSASASPSSSASARRSPEISVRRSPEISARRSPDLPTIPAGAEREVVPLRACCLECAANAKMEVQEEAFSRGALRVRRRAALFASACGGGQGLVGMGEASVVEAARRGGFLDSPSVGASPFALSGGAGGAGHGDEGAEGESGQKLMSGTGLTEVNRLVAELERRRASRSGTPTPPVSPTYPSSHGRASPSLLGPALARIVTAEREAANAGSVYGERLTPGSACGSGSGSRHGSGTASPLLPLGIAVDEVDKERRRRSEDLGMRDVVVLGDDDDEYELVDDFRCPASAPPTTYAFSAAPSGYALASSPSGYAASSPSLGINTNTTGGSGMGMGSSRRRSYTPNKPVAGYVDDDDAELFPLPSRSASGSPRSAGTPVARSPAASASDVSLGVTGAGGQRERVSPKAGALLPVALTGAAKERERESSSGSGSGSKETPPPSPRESERRERERSRSEAVCVALGSMGRREREERERGASASAGQPRERERNWSGASASGVSKCARGLLLPPGDERECDAGSGSSSASNSREGSRERGSGSSEAGAEAGKPLPVLPPLATSVLAAGPYSPVIEKPVERQEHGSVGKGSHLRGASAPAAPGSSGLTTSTTRTVTPTPTPPTARSTSATSSTKPTSGTKPIATRAKSGSTSLAAAPLLAPGTPTLRRASSFARMRSASSSSAHKSGGGGGRNPFGALVDVLKGVTFANEARRVSYRRRPHCTSSAVECLPPSTIVSLASLHEKHCIPKYLRFLLNRLSVPRRSFLAPSIHHRILVYT